MSAQQYAADVLRCAFETLQQTVAQHPGCRVRLCIDIHTDPESPDGISVELEVHACEKPAATVELHADASADDLKGYDL